MPTAMGPKPNNKPLTVMPTVNNMCDNNENLKKSIFFSAVYIPLNPSTSVGLDLKITQQ